jgi:hypothetical protein
MDYNGAHSVPAVRAHSTRGNLARGAASPLSLRALGRGPRNPRDDFLRRGRREVAARAAAAADARQQAIEQEALARYQRECEIETQREARERERLLSSIAQRVDQYVGQPRAPLASPVPTPPSPTPIIDLATESESESAEVTAESDTLSDASGDTLHWDDEEFQAVGAGGAAAAARHPDDWQSCPPPPTREDRRELLRTDLAAPYSKHSRCQFCNNKLGTTGSKTHCSACATAGHYCSVHCQTADWPRHKAYFCHRVRAPHHHTIVRFVQLRTVASAWLAPPQLTPAEAKPLRTARHANAKAARRHARARCSCAHAVRAPPTHTRSHACRARREARQRRRQERAARRVTPAS